ncbi:hypothetical protein [Nibricoccus sp. IMCC34717]|uniref:hypothetical protein n=1 Tax=Nibricoccus sp. IMCC34717 TaxID=3034021 RepID=UPI00384D3B14
MDHSPSNTRKLRAAFLIGERLFGYWLEESTARAQVFDVADQMQREIERFPWGLDERTQRFSEAIEEEFCVSVSACPRMRRLSEEIFEAIDFNADPLVVDDMLCQVGDLIASRFWAEVNPYLNHPVPASRS